MKNFPYSKYIKLILGTFLSIAVANALSLSYSYSAGIISLLTIQDTKRETVFITGKRIIIFFIMTFLSTIIFQNFGFSLLSFGIILIPYLFLCMILDMKEAIAPIAVLCTHYISEGSCSFEVILNEFLILLVGAGTGILLNLFFSDKKKLIQNKQKAVEEKMRGIFSSMAEMMIQHPEAVSSDRFFHDIDSMLFDLKKEATSYINNHFLSGNDYYLNYVSMRISQCRLLKQIYEDILKLDMVPEQAMKISAYFHELSIVFQESNNAALLLTHLDSLYHDLVNDDLPVTRVEFENRARLFHILEDIRRLIMIKKDFVTIQSHAE